MMVKVKIKNLDSLIEISKPILISNDGVDSFHLQSNEFMKTNDGKGTFNPAVMMPLCGEEIEVDDEFYADAYNYHLVIDEDRYMDLVIGKWMVAK